MPTQEPQIKLAANLVRAAHQVQVGARYRHYKNRSYIVIGLALREADCEPCVIYQADYDPHLTWIRPVAHWAESVSVDGKTMPRFALMDDQR